MIGPKQSTQHSGRCMGKQSSYGDDYHCAGYKQTYGRYTIVRPIAKPRKGLDPRKGEAALPGVRKPMKNKDKTKDQLHEVLKTLHACQTKLERGVGVRRSAAAPASNPFGERFTPRKKEPSSTPNPMRGVTQLCHQLMSYA